MTDQRIYVIVPKTVQVITRKALDVPEELRGPEDSYHPEVFQDTIESFSMVPGPFNCTGSSYRTQAWTFCSESWS